MRVLCFLGLVALAALASAAPAPKAQPTEYISITDVIEAAGHIKDIFEEVKAKIESGVVKGEIEDFLKHIKDVVEAKIQEAKPVVAEILAQMKAAIQEMIDQVKSGIEQVKPVLQELVEKIIAKINELKNKLIGGYSIFDDLLNDVLKPALGKAIENLIPTIQKHLGELIDKLVPKEYISIVDIMEAAAALKDIFEQVKAKIESGEVQDNVLDFLEKIKAVVEAKIEAATPTVKAILAKVDAAVQDVITKAQAGIESGKGLLVELLETIIAKIGELKDGVAGYNIFDDLLNDVLKPAVKHAIENLIPTIAKHLGDLADKLKPKEYLSITGIVEAAQALKDIFATIKAKKEAGLCVCDDVIEFLFKTKIAIDCKIRSASVAGKAILEKVGAAIEIVIAKAKAQGATAKEFFDDLIETIIAKIGELKDDIAGYNNIFADLLKPLKSLLNKVIGRIINCCIHFDPDYWEEQKPIHFKCENGKITFVD